MKRKLNVMILGIVAILIGFVGCENRVEKDATNIPENELFKVEHEELNGVPHPDNPDRIFKEMYIPENNPYIYADYDEINQLLEEGTGIIYFGFPTCPWCRSLVPVLTDAAIDFGVEEILYRNVFDDRNVLELEDDEIIEVSAGHPGYYEVLDILGDHAPEYTGLQDDTIRRILVPAVVFVQDGQVIGYHESLPAFQERVSQEELGGWLPMNEGEVEELTQVFMTYFEQLFGE